MMLPPRIIAITTKARPPIKPKRVAKSTKHSSCYFPIYRNIKRLFSLSTMSNDLLEKTWPTSHNFAAKRQNKAVTLDYFDEAAKCRASSRGFLQVIASLLPF
ncbi:TPA: hypothetical protein I7747_24065 [Vibrio vulnificus]|nr:hypothetical protein [Vibrio vulnificus]HAS8425634.1 hypothetical protein [Vibrio vulnificus]